MKKRQISVERAYLVICFITLCERFAVSFILDGLKEGKDQNKIKAEAKKQFLITNECIAAIFRVRDVFGLAQLEQMFDLAKKRLELYNLERNKLKMAPENLFLEEVRARTRYYSRRMGDLNAKIFFGTDKFEP